MNSTRLRNIEMQTKPISRRMQQKHAQRVWNAVRAKCKKHSVQGSGGARRTGSKNVGGAKRVMCRKRGVMQMGKRRRREDGAGRVSFAS